MELRKKNRQADGSSVHSYALLLRCACRDRPRKRFNKTGEKKLLLTVKSELSMSERDRILVKNILN